MIGYEEIRRTRERGENLERDGTESKMELRRENMLNKNMREYTARRTETVDKRVQLEDKVNGPKSEW